MSERAHTHTNSLPILGKSSSNTSLPYTNCCCCCCWTSKIKQIPKRMRHAYVQNLPTKTQTIHNHHDKKVLHSQVTHIAIPVFGYTSRRNAIHYKTLSLKCIFKARSRSRTLTRTSNDLANVSRKKKIDIDLLVGRDECVKGSRSRTCANENRNDVY